MVGWTSQNEEEVDTRLVKDRELNGNGKSSWWLNGRRLKNESIIFRLDSESRFRDFWGESSKKKADWLLLVSCPMQFGYCQAHKFCLSIASCSASLHSQNTTMRLHILNARLTLWITDISRGSSFFSHFRRGAISRIEQCSGKKVHI